MTMTEPVTESGCPLTPRGIHRAARRSGAWIYSLPPLLFMAFAIVPAWDEGPVPAALAVTALCFAYSLLFAYSSAMPAYPARVGAWWLAASWIVLGLLALLVGPSIGSLAIYVLVLHGIVLRGKTGLVVLGLITVAGVALGLLSGEVLIILLTLTGAAIAVGIQQGIDREIAESALAAERERNAALAVVAERERISRDLHDILGHSLTTITVSAQLARRLAQVDPALAAEQLAEIEQLSRQALSDVRATVSGMREVRVATEIAAARSVLEAAGVRADAPAALPPLSDERAELFGYVVREAITNTVRHARAGTCRIEVRSDEVVVVDDGVGIPDEHGGGGLAGLRRRLEEAGGALEVRSGPTGTTLRASVPAESGAEPRTDQVAPLSRRGPAAPAGSAAGPTAATVAPVGSAVAPAAAPAPSAREGGRL